MSELKTVIIIEDDLLIAEYLRDLVEDIGCAVLGMAHDQPSADRLLEEARPHYILMDLRLGAGIDGVDLARAHYERDPHAKLIFITGSLETPTIARIAVDHPHRILRKPIEPNALREALA